MINVRLLWPPSVNHYTTVVRGRKILSNHGRKYEKQSILGLVEQHAPKGLKGRIEVDIEAHPPDKRRRDLDNLLKPILDVLQGELSLSDIKSLCVPSAYWA